MQSKKLKDQKLRRQFDRSEILIRSREYLLLNSLGRFNDQHILSKSKLFFSLSKQNNISKVKIVRRCILTNRSRGNIRVSAISRMQLKNFINNGRSVGFY